MRTIRAFLWGTAIGAMLGILFAPQHGELTRSQLKDRLNSWQDQAQTGVGTLRDRTSQLIEQGRKTTNSVLHQTSKANDQLASTLQDAVTSRGSGAQ